MDEFTEVRWAQETAASLLAPTGRRWTHTLGVVERAEPFCSVLPAWEFEVLVAAAYLHDVGYAQAVAGTGFHALDGALFLRRAGCERLSCLVAYHSGSRAAAAERGLVAELQSFVEEESTVAAALTYCDLTTGASGERVGARARLAEVMTRYGTDHPVGRAVRRSCSDLLGVVNRFSSLQ